jgi:hypothetical protein
MPTTQHGDGFICKFFDVLQWAARALISLGYGLAYLVGRSDFCFGGRSFKIFPQQDFLNSHTVTHRAPPSSTITTILGVPTIANHHQPSTITMPSITPTATTSRAPIQYSVRSNQTRRPDKSQTLHTSSRTMPFCSILLSSFVIYHVLSCAALAVSSPPNVIIVGGSSGMGKAAAIAAVQRGGKALIVSRSKSKLDRAAKEVAENAKMGGSVSIFSLDVTDERAVQEFGESIADGEWDSLVHRQERHHTAP